MNVLEVLRGRLAASRRAGIAFDEAWPDAAYAALRCARARERTARLMALEDTRHAWVPRIDGSRRRDVSPLSR